MLKHFLRLGLEPRIPPQLYADRLSAETASELMLMRESFLESLKS